jgi:hypothetical protein
MPLKLDDCIVLWRYIYIYVYIYIGPPLETVGREGRIDARGLTAARSTVRLPRAERGGNCK